MILVPIITGLMGGFGADLVDYITQGIVAIAPTGVMFIFAILFFGILTDTGAFRPIINGLLKIAGNDPARKVRFDKASGIKATDSFKVSVGYTNGFLGEGQISYGGINCTGRAKIAGEIVLKRLQNLGCANLKVDLIGLN